MKCFRVESVEFDDRIDRVARAEPRLDRGDAGDIATGALIGRAFEPRAGKSPSGASGHGLCLNCGTALIGNFCHACGQSEHVHRSLASIGHDLLHGVFHFEGKIWRTVPMLLLHPGALTRRYIAGERVRFVSPLALFLFSVFLMFATLHTFGGEMAPDLSPAKRGQATAKLDAKIAEATARLDAAKARHARFPATAPDSDLVAAQERVDSLKSARAVLTKAGLQKLREAPVSHVAQIEELLGARFDETELRDRRRLLSRLGGAGCADCDPDG